MDLASHVCAAASRRILLQDFVEQLCVQALTAIMTGSGGSVESEDVDQGVRGALPQSLAVHPDDDAADLQPTTPGSPSLADVISCLRDVVL